MNGKLDLTEKIVQTLSDSKAEPWFPSLTCHLVRRAEIELLEPIGLSLSTYSTERFIRRDPQKPRNFVGAMPTSSSNFISIEQLDDATERSYRDLGLLFLTPIDFDELILASLRQGLQLIETIPSLSISIGQLVRSLHALRVVDDSYDVSHSDPRLPFSIFLSFPRCDADLVGVRIMESVIHEAMHLQLTLIENYICFTNNVGTLLPSPWRSDNRPPAGIFHGIYVFTNIARAYTLLLLADVLSTMQSQFAKQRLINIAAELSAAVDTLRPEFLSYHGKILISRLGRTQIAPCRN